jgi:hypothetical protein
VKRVRKTRLSRRGLADLNTTPDFARRGVIPPDVRRGVAKPGLGQRVRGGKR